MKEEKGTRSHDLRGEKQASDALVELQCWVEKLKKGAGYSQENFRRRREIPALGAKDVLSVRERSSRTWGRKRQFSSKTLWRHKK